MPSHSYDFLVIGAGPAGSGAANDAAKAGHSVALIERDKIGGTCLNYGCDPTKALLHLAAQLHEARRAARTGLRLGDPTADWEKVQAYLRKTINQVRGGSDAATRRKLGGEGMDVYRGTARFLSPHEVRVNGETLRAEQILIATGSVAAAPPVEGLRDAGFITNKEAVSLPALPRRLAIIGGGPIGVEFAQMFSRFGVEVTILEQSDELLAKDDRELAAQLCTLLSNEGIHIEAGVELQEVSVARGRKHLQFSRRGHATERLIVDEIMVAAGFRPVLEGLDLHAAGVETTDEGIVADDFLRTSVPHIWAAGDVAGGYKFTHVAYEQGRLVAHNAFAARARRFDASVVPWVTYTSPELAHVGRTEAELREAGVSFRVGVKPMDGIERAVLMGQPDGMVKLLVGNDGTILGGHILGVSAGELIAPVALAMRAGLKAADLAETILPYPTVAEGVRWAAEEALKA